jgi:alkylation response protein AidB-like acyl-CoA dehydrogenase
MADSRAANIQFRGVTATRDQVLGPIGGAAEIRTHARRRAHRLAAEMLGSTEECFDRTIKYLKEREQLACRSVRSRP